MNSFFVSKLLSLILWPRMNTHVIFLIIKFKLILRVPGVCISELKFCPFNVAHCFGSSTSEFNQVTLLAFVKYFFSLEFLFVPEFKKKNY